MASASPTTVQPSTDEPAGVAADAVIESAERRKRQQREWTAHERAEAKAKVAAAPPTESAASTAPSMGQPERADDEPRAEVDSPLRRRRFPAPDLPEGWLMEIRTRGHGDRSEGQTYTLWYPPDGRKVLRSRKEVERFLAGGYSATKEAKPLPEQAPPAPAVLSSATARPGHESTGPAERASVGEEPLVRAARIVGEHYSAHRTQLLRLSSEIGPQSANPRSELAVIFQSIEHALHRFLAIIREWYASVAGAQGREGCLALGRSVAAEERKFHQFAAVLMNNQLRYLVSTKAMRQSMQMSARLRDSVGSLMEVLGSLGRRGLLMDQVMPSYVDPRGLASSQPSRFVATAAPPRQQPLYVPAAPGYGHRAPAAQPASTLDRTPIDTLLAQRVPPAQAMLALLAHIQRAASAADEPPRPRERRPTQGSATPLPTVLETVAMALGSRR